MTLTEIYNALPMTAATLWRHFKDGSCDLLPSNIALVNDLGRVNEFRVVDDSGELGIVIYHKGRKLCCHELVKDNYRKAVQS